MERAVLDECVEALAEKRTRRQALHRLMEAGPEATDALRTGLGHRHATVRVGCCIVLDHHLDDAAVPELLANVHHKNRKVRAFAMHALACDRCKEGDCRPGATDVVPLVIDRLTNDPSTRVRSMAVGLAAQYLAAPGIADALARAAESDPHSKVRNRARWELRKLATSG
jgi:HEAT repeat protein